MARQAAVADTPNALRAVGAAFAVVALALVVLLLVRARPAPDPLDPRSGRSDGARGLVLTLDAAGGEVDDSRSVPGVDRVADTRLLVLVDQLDPDQRAAVIEFAEAGGVVVVADPDSSLHGGSGLDGGAVEVVGDLSPELPRVDPRSEANVRPGGCNIAALSELRGVFARDGVLFPVGPSEPQCLTAASGDADSHSFVIVRRFGDGLVIGLGDNQPFTNRDLRFADNAGLAVALLVPTADSDVVIVIGTGSSTGNVEDVGQGDDTLFDLVPGGVWMALGLAALSFVVFATSRGIRVGAVRTEPLAAPVAGSELVSATGNLMQRARHRERAAQLLRERLRRDLCATYGLAPTTPSPELDAWVTAQSPLEPGLVTRVLDGSVPDDAMLVSVTNQIHEIRSVALHQVTHSPNASDAPSDERTATP